MIAPLRFVGRWAISLVMIVVIVGCAAWVVPTFFGYSRYVITSGSMTGTYNTGSIVFEKNVPVSDLKVGDVITYQPPPGSGVNHLVTHRIYRIQQAVNGGRLFTTKGDHNPGPDPWHFELTSPQQGVVQFGLPTAGWIFIELAQKNVRMLVIGLPAALIGLGALAQLIAALRRPEEASEDATPSRWVPPPIQEQELTVG